MSPVKSASYLVLSPPNRAPPTNNISFELVNNAPQHRALVEDYEAKLSSHDDHLKSAMNALNEKLKFYENIEREKHSVHEQLAYSDKGREQLRAALIEAADKVKEE